jgi:hypothetical protein
VEIKSKKGLEEIKEKLINQEIMKIKNGSRLQS